MAIPSLPGVSGSNKLAADKATSVVSGTLSAVGPSKAFSVWGPFNLLIWAEIAATLNTTAGSLAATVGSATGLAAGNSIKSTRVPYGATIGALSGTDVTLALMPQWWQGTITTKQALIGNMGPGDNLGITTPASLASLVGATILDSPYFASGVTITAVGSDGRSLVTSAAPTIDTAQNQPIQICFAPGAAAIPTTGADTAAAFTGPLITPTSGTVRIERSADGGQTWIPCNIGGSGSQAVFDLTGGPISMAFGDPEQAMIYRLNVSALTVGTGKSLKYRVSTTGQAAQSISLQTL